MKKIFLLILFAQIISFIIIPPFQIPDESGHYENVIWLSKGKYPYQVLEKNKKYPYLVEEMEKYYQTKFDFKKIINNPLKNKKQTDFEKKVTQNYQPINFQAYHPFLYYLLLTPGQFLANFLNTDIITRFYITRLFSAILFWVLIFAVYQILIIYKLRKEDIKTFLLFYALNPIIIYYSIGINPDLGVAIFSTFFLFLTLKFKNNLDNLKIFLLAIFAGFCYLNKTSGLIVLPYALIFIFLNQKIMIEKIKKILLFLFFYFLTISPWIILSLKRYHTLTTPSFYIAHQGPIVANSFFKSLFLAFFEFRHTIMHYSGFLGAQNHLWPNKFYFVFYTILVSILFLIGFLKFYKKYYLLSLYLFLSFCFFYLLGFYFKKTGFLWDLQGRYFILAFFPFYFFVFLSLKNQLFINNFLIKIFAIINYLAILFFLLIVNFYQKTNLFNALNVVYPFFGFIFIIALAMFIFLSVIILFKNNG